MRLLFSVVFSLVFFCSDARAEAERLNYQMPVRTEPTHKLANVLIDVKASNGIIAALHLLGVAVSRDEGKTFKEFPLIAASYNVHELVYGGKSALHINKETGTVYVNNRSGFYRIDNRDQLTEISGDSPDSITSIGKNVFGTQWGHYSEDVRAENYFYASSDDGEHFLARTFGKERDKALSSVDEYDGTLFVDATCGLPDDINRAEYCGYKSNQSPNSDLVRMDSKDPVYQRYVEQKKKDGLRMTRDLLDLTIPRIKPVLVIGTLRFFTLALDHIRVEYENENLDSFVLRPGAFYEAEKNGTIHYVRSEDLPREVAYDRQKDTVYFASHTGVWKINR